MHITEDEAKKKWCPFTFAVTEIRAGDGQGIREPGPWTCLGSLCMAWRRASSNSDETYGECAMMPPLQISVNNNY